MVALIFILVSSCSIGSLLLRPLKIAPSNIVAHVVLSLSLGMGVWCFFLFGAGLIGILNKWVFLAAGVLPVVPAIAAMEKTRFGRIRIPALSWFEWTLLGGIAALSAVSFIACFAPVVGGISNDEICTHLSAPAEWLSAGALCTPSQNIMYMAGNTELLFMLAESFSPESGPRLLSFLSFLLCLSVVYFIAERHSGRRAGIVSAAIASVNPLVFRHASVAFVDLFSALYVLLPVWMLLTYRKNRGVGHLLCAAFFMGLGCGIKPTNYLYSFMTVLFALALFLVEKDRPIIKKSAIVIMATVAFALPWPARNMALTGSPTYPPPAFWAKTGWQKPLLADRKGCSPEEIKWLYAYCNSRYGDYRRSATNLLLFPWRMTMDPARFQIGDSLGTVLLSLLPIALVIALYRKKRWAVALFCIACGASAGLYLFVLPEARYFMGAALLLAPLLALAASRPSSPLPLVIGARAVVLLNVLFALLVIVRIHAAGVRCFFDKAKRTAYIHALRPYAEAFDYLAAMPGAAVVVAYPNQNFYYLHRKYIVDDSALMRPGRHNGAYFFDIDYSQQLDRDPRNLKHDYILSTHTPFLEKVFEGPDARIYRFVK